MISPPWLATTGLTLVSNKFIISFLLVLQDLLFVLLISFFYQNFIFFCKAVPIFADNIVFNTFQSSFSFFETDINSEFNNTLLIPFTEKIVFQIRT